MIDDILKERIKKTYSTYAYTKDQIKDETAALNDMIKGLAKEMNVKPGILNKFFANQYKKVETGIDEIALITELSVEIETPDMIEEEKEEEEKEEK